MREPSPRSINSGSPPTGRNARTGLFTPPAVTGLTPSGESAGFPRLPSAAPVQAKPGEDEQSSNGHEDCAHYSPEHLSGHEATGQYADALQQPDAAHEDHQPSYDQ